MEIECIIHLEIDGSNVGYFRGTEDLETFCLSTCPSRLQDDRHNSNYQILKQIDPKTEQYFALACVYTVLGVFLMYLFFN